MTNEMTVDELERLLGSAGERSLARERAEDREAMELCDMLEDLERERKADAAELVLSGWKDDFGRPIEGFESPRFTTPRQSDYLAWVQSAAGTRTRENVHPKLAERMSRGTR
jgi:hypothetical protein